MAGAVTEVTLNWSMANSRPKHPDIVLMGSVYAFTHNKGATSFGRLSESKFRGLKGGFDQLKI